MTEPLYFQDVVPVSSHCPQHENDDSELSAAFFELANVHCVGYRLSAKQLRKNKKPNKNGISVVVEQDPAGACGQHTGGIVWETAYLLANYLLSRKKKLGKVLEVGAGCGMLGLVLAASGGTKQVVLTETDSVMKNLMENIERNDSTAKGATGCQLDWTHVERDAEIASIQPHSFHTIVGTDVIFSPSLVEPLLHTLQYMSRKDTIVYLCLQVRCPDSHRLLLEKASIYGWSIKDLSKELILIPDCAWGLQMECQLLRLTRMPQKVEASAESDGNKRRKPDGNDRKKRTKR